MHLLLICSISLIVVSVRRLFRARHLPRRTKMILKLTVLIVLTLISHTTSLDLCEDSHVKCDSCNAVTVCIIGLPVTLLCPLGTYCDSTSIPICRLGFCPSEFGSETSTEKTTPTTPSTTTTVPTTTTPSTTTAIATTEPTIAADFICNSFGLFSDTADPSCQSYYLCYPTWTSYNSWRLKCPTELVFNPTNGKCVKLEEYTCPLSTKAETTNTISETSAATPTTLTTVPLTTTLSTTTITPTRPSTTTSFTTTVIPTTETPSTTSLTTTSTTFTPSTTTPSTTTPTTTTPPATTISTSTPTTITPSTAIPSTATTATTITTPSTTTSTTTITTTATPSTTTPATPTPTITITPSTTTDSTTAADFTRNSYGRYSDTTDSTTAAEFTCNSYGRYPDTTDSSCQSYYLCYRTWTSFDWWLMKCPTTLVFDSNIGKCVLPTEYACPFSATPSTTSTTTTTTTVASTTTIEPTTDPTTPSEFVCQSSGRFPDTSDSSCQSYYLCYPTWSSYTWWHMKCGTILIFNPTIGKCVLPTDYVCPY
ncbi:cell wall protein DAN4-like [Orussus abietinus]|uniref:cell wall protein DAN4-like n=1 Tax=Orussus abietinus TaxID=222816 RepID=UPI0006258D8D|nr:cell wall protein DAN4-like [Orussus abietinus]